MQVRVYGPIGHQSVRLRKFLRIQEEEACRWKVKVLRDPDQKKSTGGGRWIAPPDFGVPGPFTSRPLSPQGRVSFHFSQATVSKGPGGTSIITAEGRTRELGPSAAAEHDHYSTREEAVLTVSEAAFQEYIGRPSAVENSDGQTRAIISNISDDPAERRDFWLKVHEHEREAKPDRLVFHRSRLSVSGWRLIAAAEALPKEVREVADRMSQRSLGSSRAKGDASLEMDRAQAYKVRQSIRELLGEKRAKEPVRVAKGRRGRTQYRLTAEFPAGLDAAARLRILRQFCQELGDLGVMYTAAIHAPDQHNDDRNDHLHIVYYDRPCSRLPDGHWDFEVAVAVEGQHNRFSYPYRQPKIAELSRSPEGTNPRAYRASVIYSMREHFADLCNEQLIKIGSSRLFDPRRYSEMGIDQTPTKPLGPKAAPLEAAGVPTRQGIENAEILWTYRLKEIRRDCEKRRKDRVQLIAELDGVVSEMDRSGNTGEASRLRTTIAEARTCAAVLDTHELEMEEFAVTLDMAYARPDKVAETCNRILEALNKGKGSKSDRKAEALIAGRKADAEAFISEVDIIRDQSLTVIEPILSEVEAARATLAGLAEDLPALRDLAHVRLGKVEKKDERVAEGRAPPTAGASLHARIDGVLKNVLDHHVVIEPSANQPLHTVPGISREEFQLLSSEQLSRWIQARLASIAAQQKKRAGAAAILCRKFGFKALIVRANECSDAKRAVQHIAAYQDHPIIKELYEEILTRSQPVASSSGVAEPSRGSDREQPPHLTTGIEASEESIENSQDTATAPSRWTPSLRANSITAREAADTSRERGIAAYADFIRTGEGIKFVEIDGVQRVDATSLQGASDGEEFDWRISGFVFEDEEAVKKAIRDRAASDLAREQDAAMAAQAAEQRQERQLTVDRILRELDICGRRPVFRCNNRWEVIDLQPEIIEYANSWQDDPALARAYERADSTWSFREAKEAKEQIARADFLYPINSSQEEEICHPSGESAEPNAQLWKAFKDRDGQGVG